MRCHACNKTIPPGELLRCSVCRITYDYKCLNISRNYFLSNFSTARYTWECLSCVTAFQHNIDNMLMRCQSMIQDANIYNDPLRLENPPLENAIQNEASEMINYLPATSNITYEQFRSLFYSKFNKIRNGMYTTGLESPLEKNIIKCNHLLDLTSASLSFLRNELNNRSTSEESRSISELRDISSISEKFTRSSNLEIQLIPERENENLLGILETICHVIKAPFDKNAVLNIRRISKINRQSNRPRNIITTFPTQTHRDDIISAYKRYNKYHKRELLNTSNIGISGDKCNIFLSEHLTPKCKEIHIATRKIAKELGFKHVWVRNDYVYIRKYDKSPAFRINDMADVQKLKYYDLFF